MATRSESVSSDLIASMRFDQLVELAQSLGGLDQLDRRGAELATALDSHAATGAIIGLRLDVVFDIPAVGTSG